MAKVNATSLVYKTSGGNVEVKTCGELLQCQPEKRGNSGEFSVTDTPNLHQLQATVRHTVKFKFPHGESLRTKLYLEFLF